MNKEPVNCFPFVEIHRDIKDSVILECIFQDLDEDFFPIPQVFYILEDDTRPYVDPFTSRVFKGTKQEANMLAFMLTDQRTNKYEVREVKA